MKETFNMLKLEEIRAFLAERPLLTQRGLSLESGISDSLLGKILRGQRNMTEDVSAKLEPILRKYGFK
jgi:hypothetical protein